MWKSGRERFLQLLLCSAKVRGPSLLYASFCSHRRQCWYAVLISTPCVAFPPLTHAFSLCLLKSGTQLSPFSVSLFHPPSLSLTVNESLEHNYPCSLSLSCTLSIHPSLPLSLSGSLSTSYSFRRSLWREQLLKYLLICFPQFYLFPSLPSCPPFSPLHRPRNTSSAMRCQRRRRAWKSTTWNHYLAFVAPSSFTCVNKTKGTSVGWRQTAASAAKTDWAVRQVDCSGYFDATIADRKHQGAFFCFFCQCKGSCIQLRAIEAVVMATMQL